MKHKNKILALLLAVAVLIGTMGVENLFQTVNAANVNYEKNVMYDATEQYLKVQPMEYSYNGYKVHALSQCSTMLSDEHGIGEKYTLFSGDGVLEGEKIVIEFNTPINGNEFSSFTLAIKHFPGSEFNLYNASDDILSTVRKTIKFSSYGVENITLRSIDFADSKGFVNAVVLECTKIGQQGQFFVDGFSVANTDYKLNEWYDATTEYFKKQSSFIYQNMDVIPFLENSTFWSEEAKLESDDGYALIAATADGKPVSKGDLLILEFNHEIKASKFPYLNISMVTGSTASAEFEFYNVTEIKDGKLGTLKQTGVAGAWNFIVTSLCTKDFADEEGYVSAIALKCVSDEANTFSIGGFSFTSKESSVIGDAIETKPYELNVFYDASESYLKTQGITSFKGVNIAPFTERTTFWEKEAKIDSDKGYGLIAHQMDGRELEKGNVMILEFVVPISTAKFEVLNMTLATATQGGATFEVYSVEEIQNGKLGPVRGRIMADFWAFKTNSIALETLGNGEGYVEAIALKLVSNEAQTFTVGGFSLSTMDSLIEKNGADILDDKIQVEETDDTYNFYIEFNKAGSANSNANEKILNDMILLNNVPLSEINKDKTYVKVQWQQMGRYYLYISVDKEYEGAGAIINQDKFLVGNCIELKKGLEMPGGDKLSETYNLHVYLTSNVTDVESNTIYSPIEVNKIYSRIDQNGDLMISVTFNNHITGSAIYYACNPDAFNRKDLAALNSSSITYYDANIAKAFINGGYKSSVLDNLLINGNTIAEWLATDKLSESPAFNTAVMVHYGMEGNKVMTIVITDLSVVGGELIEKHENNELNITFKEGLKFSSGKQMKDTTSYQYVDGVWNLVAKGEFAVYYDGCEVKDGDVITCEKAANAANISVTGEGIYTIKERVSGTKAEYSICEGDKELMKFTVEGTEPAVVTVYDNDVNFTPYIVLGGAILTVAVLVVLLFLIRRRKNAKKDAN